MEEVINEIDDYLIRWRKHIKIIELLKTSNLNQGEVNIWENQINNFFTTKIKSKL